MTFLPFMGLFFKVFDFTGTFFWIYIYNNLSINGKKLKSIHVFDVLVHFDPYI